MKEKEDIVFFCCYMNKLLSTFHLYLKIRLPEILVRGFFAPPLRTESNMAATRINKVNIKQML